MANINSAYNDDERDLLHKYLEYKDEGTLTDRDLEEFNDVLKEVKGIKEVEYVKDPINDIIIGREYYVVVNNMQLTIDGSIQFLNKHKDTNWIKGTINKIEKFRTEYTRGGFTEGDPPPSKSYAITLDIDGQKYVVKNYMSDGRTIGIHYPPQPRFFLVKAKASGGSKKLLKKKRKSRKSRKTRRSRK